MNFRFDWLAPLALPCVVVVVVSGGGGGAGLNDGLFQKRWTLADNRRSIVTLQSVLSAVCV